jgi:hypothetical protein
MIYDEESEAKAMCGNCTVVAGGRSTKEPVDGRMMTTV